jgi:hypothetical protein
LFGIDFQHNGTAGHVSRNFGNLRRSHATGAAPRSPKIYQHRHAGVLPDLIKLFPAY